MLISKTSVNKYLIPKAINPKIINEITAPTMMIGGIQLQFPDDIPSIK